LTEYKRIKGEEQVPRWEAIPLGLGGCGMDTGVPETSAV